jgi:hypothetical protein
MYGNILSWTIYFAEANSYGIHGNLGWGLRRKCTIMNRQFEVMFPWERVVFTILLKAECVCDWRTISLTYPAYITQWNSFHNIFMSEAALATLTLSRWLLLEKLIVALLLKFPYFMDRTIDYRVHKSPALVPILSQTNPIHTHPISLISISTIFCSLEGRRFDSRSGHWIFNLT